MSAAGTVTQMSVRLPESQKGRQVCTHPPMMRGKKKKTLNCELNDTRTKRKYEKWASQGMTIEWHHQCVIGHSSQAREGEGEGEGGGAGVPCMHGVGVCVWERERVNRRRVSNLNLNECIFYTRHDRDIASQF